MPKQAKSPADRLPVPVELIARRIYLIRGQKVMLDTDLADLYRVETRGLVQAVKRNLERFPGDFMFQLSPEEAESMRSQFVIASKRNIRYQPYAFTEHGVAMLSAVLKSDRAVQMSILIVRAFVQIRELLATNKDLAARVEKLEAGQKKHASIIGILAEEIDELKLLPEPPKRRIGFKT
jgi:ORF6N domain